jgi:predicted transcriptional regulator
METRVLTAHVPVDLATKVDEVAARIERSRGWVIKQALAAWVATICSSHCRKRAATGQ